MSKIKEYKVIIIIILVLILGAFYWYELRPTSIRKECIKQYPSGFGSVGRLPALDKANYERCLREHGLNK